MAYDRIDTRERLFSLVHTGADRGQWPGTFTGNLSVLAGFHDPNPYSCYGLRLRQTRMEPIDRDFCAPPHHQLPARSVAALAASFGLGTREVQLLPDVGITNAIYAVGKSLVLRVPARPRLRANLGP